MIAVIDATPLVHVPPTAPVLCTRLECAVPTARGAHSQDYAFPLNDASKHGLTVFWGDQIGVKGEPTVTTGPASHDHTTVLRQTATPITLSMMRAVTNRGAVCFLIYEAALSTAILVRFCRRLVASTEGRAVYLILDHLPVHHARAFRQWTDDHRHQFTVYYLPTFRS